MKVVPLLSDDKALELELQKLSLVERSSIDEDSGAELASNTEEEEEDVDELEEPEPVWSDARDVAREIELGRLVGALPGFCKLKA